MFNKTCFEIYITASRGSMVYTSVDALNSFFFFFLFVFVVVLVLVFYFCPSLLDLKQKQQIKPL